VPAVGLVGGFGVLTVTPGSVWWLDALIEVHPRWVLRWENPPYNPTGVAGRNRFPAVEPECPETLIPDVRHAAELRAWPHRWGCVFESGHMPRVLDQTHRCLVGQSGFGIGFQAATRRLVGGGWGTYARYVGRFTPRTKA
jgi:hypothetical protein